jgi:hypothetical protein
MSAIRFGTFVSAMFVFASACSSRDVRIVAGTNDSLVINNRVSVPLPVYGVDIRGRRHAIVGLRYQQISGDSISLTEDGRVTCSARADARVRVSHERLMKTFSLLCRPILAVSVKRLWVLADGDSAALDPIAIDVDGKHEALIAGVAVVEDTSIAYVAHGKVFGRRPGETNISIDAGDCSDWTRIEVDERVPTSLGLTPFQVFVSGPVELAPGELRTWQVTPGPYAIWTDHHAEPGFAFGTANMNCADGVRAGQYSCIALANGTVVVRNMRRTGAVHGTVFVSRQPDPVRDPADSRARPLRGPVTRPSEQRLPPGWCNPQLAKRSAQLRPSQSFERAWSNRRRSMRGRIVLMMEL